MSTNGLPHLPNEVELIALHYVSGDMDLAAAEAFEGRLASEPEARDALVAAMQLLAPAEVPSPGPRKAVRKWFSSSKFQRIKKYSRGLHPAWWTIAGAAAASLGFFGFEVMRVPPKRDYRQPIIGTAAPVVAAPSTEVIYSELSNAERLERVRNEQTQRRQRDDAPPANPWRPLSGTKQEPSI